MAAGRAALCAARRVGYLSAKDEKKNENHKKSPLMLIFHNLSQLSVYVSGDNRAHGGTRTSFQNK